jgi:hypothetical protein
MKMKMKTIQKFGLILAACAVIFPAGCDKDSDPVSSESDEQILYGPNKTQIGSGKKRFTVKESHTIKKGVYTLVGWVYVEEGATLTIEPGTIIKGTNKSYDGQEAAIGSSLIIERGAKIIAKGTAAEPIVFTSAQPKNSRKPSDWGGIIICGKAKNNKEQMTIEGGVESLHGGNDDDDNSGVLQYVRIEFGGYPYATDSEINGLTLGSVGRGTTIDHVQVSYCGDDSFEWFGGTVNARHLIAWHGWDDDFDTDNGYSGKIQYALVIRDPKIADTSRSNSFESDNDADGSAKAPFTSCTFSNATIVGPRVQTGFENTPAYINGGNMNPDNGSKLGVFQSAMHLRRNTKLNCFNSVAVGFPVGLIVENDKGATTQTWATNGELKIQNVFFGGMATLGVDSNGGTTGEFSAVYFSRQEGNNRAFDDIADLKLNADKCYAPQTGSPLLGGASFTDAKVSSGFDKVTYVGAFASDAASDDWTAGWANFDPQNTDY